MPRRGLRLGIGEAEEEPMKRSSGRAIRGSWMRAWTKEMMLSVAILSPWQQRRGQRRTSRGRACAPLAMATAIAWRGLTWRRQEKEEGGNGATREP